MTERIQYLHNLGFVHGDIKLHNICYGKKNSKNSHVIHLIDFGCGFKYNEKSGNHKVSKFDYMYAGNLMFSSVNICRGMQLSRRDDIESLLYLLAYMLNKSQLPWSKFQKNLAKKKMTASDIRKWRCGKDAVNEMFDFFPN